MNWKHFFLPHPRTHKKAHLISWYGMLSYVLIFILLQTSVSWVSQMKPGILGVSTVINSADVVRLTNIERQKRGLPLLKEDTRLDQAATSKAENMYAENYWAHFSPSGKDPWGFINQSGYHFSVAGENLAKNFYTAEDVVQAWMNSPTHRDNLLNPKYVDIGISVEEGELNGQKTILIVQEFGREAGYVAESQPSSAPVAAVSPLNNSLLGAATTRGLTIDPYYWMKIFGFGTLGIIGGLLAIDFVIIRRRAVYRLSSRHLPQLVLLGITGVGLWMMGPGQVI